DVAAVTGLHRLVRCKPIPGLSAQGDSLPSRSAVSDDVSLIGVPIQITSVPIEKSAARRFQQARQVGKGGFSPAIQVRQPRNLGKVEAGVRRTRARIADRRDFVFYKGILVERQPLF